MKKTKKRLCTEWKGREVVGPREKVVDVSMSRQ